MKSILHFSSKYFMPLGRVCRRGYRHSVNADRIKYCQSFLGDFEYKKYPRLPDAMVCLYE